MKIRGDILRTYQTLHTWTGIVAGLVLFIGFYAGSLTMFKAQISQWATPTQHYLAQVPTDQLDNLVLQATADFDKAKQGFTLSFNQNSSPMTWFEQGGSRGLQLDDIQRHATLSPQGELVTQLSPTNELGELIDMLHRTAGIAGKAGREDIGVLVLGIAAVLYFLALVSGIIFLLPTLVKSFFALRTTKTVSRFWLDSHNLVGIISLPFHLIIAITVVVFAFHDVFYGGLSVVYGDKPLFERSEKSTIDYSIEQLPPIATYIEQVNDLAQGYRINSLAFSDLSSNKPSLAIHIINDQALMRTNIGDVIYMHPYTFAVQYASIPTNSEESYMPIVVSFFALHFGSYGGVWGQWLYFALGLLGAFLFYSGNLLWLEKRRKKQVIQSKANRFMASLTVGICLGSLLAVVTTLLVSKWLYLLNTQINTAYLTCYYLVFFSALFYSFNRGAALSAIHLQQLLALTCLAIPITTLTTLLIPSLTLWTPSQFGDVIVDISALIFAATFYYSAKKTKQRAYFGERKSIWALSAPSVKVTSIPGQIKKIVA